MDKIFDSYIDKGFIYILSHPSYNDNIKISRSNNLNKRLKTHCCSHIENPKMIFTIESINYKLAERLIHQKLKQYKLKCETSREFFNVELIKAINTIKEVIYLVNNPIIIDTLIDRIFINNCMIQ
jgi:hypothetical protein